MKTWFNRAVVGMLLAALLLGGAAACTPKTGPANDDTLNVGVSIVPQRYFVERIGGEYVTVSVMVEPGASPATYEPKPEQLAALSKAVVYFSIGVPFENVWLDKIASANEAMQVVDTAAGIERLPMGAHHHDDGEDHEAEEEHETGALDPHIWLSPELVKIQASTMLETLAALDPKHETDYRSNYEAFVADIDALEADIRQTLAGVASRKFMVFHPSWGYFARDFDLEQISIEIGGQEPSAQELAALIDQARAEEIRVIFAQPEFSTSDAETIAKEIGGEVLLISPLAYDWLDNLGLVAATFAAVLQ
ncbi:MAG: zinc ABC transporter substrate-binding protein [Anaerolineae bacterium]|nr:zinc ABC transporter substrate-binding protein [Anaerolineae bacterium]